MGSEYVTLTTAYALCDLTPWPVTAVTNADFALQADGKTDFL